MNDIAGNNSIRGDETITFTDNLSFDGTERGGKLTTDGQLWLGSSTLPHVRKASLISDSSLTLTYSEPTSTTAQIEAKINGPVSVANGGTGLTSITSGGLLIGNGVGALTVTAQPSDGELLIGNTGGDPTLGTLTAGTGIGIVNAAGSITLSSTATVPISFPTDGGTATPAANALTIAGGTGVTTSGAGATVTIDIDSPVSVANGGTGATTLTDGGVVIGSGTGAVTVLGQATNGQLVIGSTGSDPVLASITAGSGIDVTNGAGSITIAGAAGSGVLSWVVETTTSRALLVDQGVIGNNAATITMTLPTTAAVGSVIRVVGMGAGSFKIAQNVLELIHFGTATTTTGVGGSIESTQVNDSIEIVCIVANTEWAVLSSVGNLTVT